MGSSPITRSHRIGRGMRESRASAGNSLSSARVRSQATASAYASSSAAISVSVHTWSVIPAAIAGVVGVPCLLGERLVRAGEVVVHVVQRHGVGQVLDLLGEGVGQAGELARRIPIRIVRFCRSTYEVETRAGSGSPVILRFSVPARRWNDQ